MKKLELIFENEQDMEYWKVWYSEAGEQDADYMIDNKKSTENKLFLKGNPDRCPNCSSMNALNQSDAYDKKTINGLGLKFNNKYSHICEDCGKGFNRE